ncbi:MAG: putative bifunctional diguanylate cyclase/phosphodiesterase [Solirubrobacteraceae bacterium]
MTPRQPVAAQSPDPDLRRLGKALRGRSEDVISEIRRLTHVAGPDLDDATRVSFERVGAIATKSVAQWMAGGKPEAGMHAGREAWEIFGQLAAHRAAPLHEVTKRCLRWRDAVHAVLGEIAQETGIAAQTLARAAAMTQLTLDVTLVRVCEVFESERSRTDEELLHRQEELAFMATHDQLTGLPNRTLILDRAEQMFGRARRRQTPVAALFINLDNFTAINDTLGHTAGDQLLRAIAARLDGVVRDTDALGRLGGDEFVVLAEEVSLAAGAELIAERLHEALSAPFTLPASDTQLMVTASIGIATGERMSAEDLLRDADIAMHRAKWDGKNRFVFFESGMQDVVQQRMELEMDLRGALGQDEFFLVYQPTFDLRGMTPTGVETLLRWRRPGQGVVQPNDFIPLLEETGLIVPVGRWVLEQACLQGAAWRKAGHPISVAVNVSGRQLDTDEFIADVKGAIAKSKLDPAALTLEITETTLMRDTQDTACRLRAIKELGVRIAIDDFGTGYSSLAHLQRFPVDALKIDRSFISQLAENPEGETLIRTLVQLGKALSIETLAEGIEGHDELSLLQNEQCDSGQGYLFAKPLEVEAAGAFLRDWKAPVATVPVAASGAV